MNLKTWLKHGINHNQKSNQHVISVSSHIAHECLTYSLNFIELSIKNKTIATLCFHLGFGRGHAFVGYNFNLEFRV